MATLEKINVKDIDLKGLDPFVSFIVIYENNEKFIIEEKTKEEKIFIWESVQELKDLQSKYKSNIWDCEEDFNEKESQILCDLEFLEKFDFRSVTHASIVFPFQLEEDEN